MDTYLHTLSPYIRVALDNEVPPPWKLPRRVIFDYELLYIKTGRIKVIIEDREYYGEPGDIFLFKPRESHSIEILGMDIFRQPHIHFDLCYQEDSKEVKVSFNGMEHMNPKEVSMIRDDLTKQSSFDIPNFIRLDNTDYFEKKLLDIIYEYKNKLPFYESQVKGMFIQLWTYLMREIYLQYHPHLSTQLNVLGDVKVYIESHTHSDISLDELSKVFSINKYHLIRLFKQAYGTTPIQYHQYIRIEKSKELLQFTDMSITQIAETMGFNNIHAFSRSFKRIDSLAPSYYRTNK